MNRILNIAELLYGEEVRALVFEPLIADLQNEIHANRSRAVRLRWAFAIAAAFVACLPRATFSKLPAAFVIDLAVRAVAFAVLGFTLQGLVGSTIDPSTAAAFPPTFSSTLPFLIIPVVWRIRVAIIPPAQRRLLFAAFAASAIASTIWFAEGAWTVRLAFGSGALLLCAGGWRLGRSAWAKSGSRYFAWWRHAFGCGSLLLVSTWPVKLALGIGFTARFWPSDYLLAVYAAGPLIAMMTTTRSAGVIEQEKKS